MKTDGHTVPLELAAQLCATGVRLSRLQEVVPVLPYLSLDPEELLVLMKICQGHQQDPMARFLQHYEACLLHLDRSTGAAGTSARAVQWLSLRLVARAEAEEEARLLREYFSSWAECCSSTSAPGTVACELRGPTGAAVRSGSSSTWSSSRLGVSRSVSRSSSLTRPEAKVADRDSAVHAGHRARVPIASPRPGSGAMRIARSPRTVHAYPQPAPAPVGLRGLSWVTTTPPSQRIAKPSEVPMVRPPAHAPQRRGREGVSSGASSCANPQGTMTPEGTGMQTPQCIRALSPVPSVMRSSSRGANLRVGNDATPRHAQRSVIQTSSPQMQKRMPRPCEPRICATPPQPQPMHPRVPYPKKSPCHTPIRLSGVPPIAPLGQSLSRHPRAHLHAERPT